MMSVEKDLRFAARSAGFVSLTFTFLAGLESERLLSPKDKGTQEEILYRWMQRYGKGLLRLYGLAVEARGERPPRYPGRDARGVGRIFVMNHRSMFDIFVNIAFIEANIVSRADLAEWPVIGVAARRVGTLFVDRSSKKSGAAVIQAMTGAIEQGRGVMIYPEGTTHAGDVVREFRPGGFLAAQRADAEVVPVGIAYGGDDASFVDEPFPAHLRRVSGSRVTRVGLVLGEPITPPHADVDALREAARERVQTLVNEARSLIS